MIKRHSLSMIASVGVSLMVTFSTAYAGDSKLRIIDNPEGHTLGVYREGKPDPILTQHARPDFRPYLHPVQSPDGKSVMTEFSPGHHKHQTGIYWGITNLNGRDYFHHPEGEYWRRVAIQPIIPLGDEVSWSTDYHLLSADGQPVMLEKQHWSMRETEGRFLLTLEWTAEAIVDLTIGQRPYGGLFTRMPWRDGMEGSIVNSLGQKNGAADGQRATWIDIGLKLDGRDDQAHISILDHPKNDGHPLHWRTDNQFGAGPSRAISGDWTIPSGKSVMFRHQFVIYTGAFDAVRVDEEWKKFAVAKPLGEP